MTDRPAHRAYADHLAACAAAEHGRWCQICRDLILDADAEDWQRTAKRAAATP